MTVKMASGMLFLEKCYISLFLWQLCWFPLQIRSLRCYRWFETLGHHALTPWKKVSFTQCHLNLRCTWVEAGSCGLSTLLTSSYGTAPEQRRQQNKHNFVLKVIGVQNDCLSFAPTFFSLFFFLMLLMQLVATFVTTTCMTAKVQLQILFLGKTNLSLALGRSEANVAPFELVISALFCAVCQ